MVVSKADFLENLKALMEMGVNVRYAPEPGW